jgi:short-chain fatty acids transporter
MIKSIAAFFDRLMIRYTPDTFILALFLTAITVVAALGLTESSAADLIVFWGDGFWSLMPHTMLMAMLFLGGYILATTPIVSRLVQRAALKIKSPHQAVFIVSFVSSFGCLINWGFGLVASSFLCREIIKVMPRANFRLMVASAYGGFLLFHGGLSGSIPLIVATKGNFSESMIGRLIPLSETLLSPLNLFLSGTLLFLMPLVNWAISRSEGPQDRVYKVVDEGINFDDASEEDIQKGPAEKLELSRSIGSITGAFGLFYVALKLLRGEFSIELKTVCFLLVFLALLFQKNIRIFLLTVNEGAKRVGPILIQFPFFMQALQVF